jgi:putative FmdB family regulatory protein
MPLYEYQCTRCGHQFEVVHPVSESVDRCERCGAPVRRVFSPVGIIFKGSGFYVTDYRKTPASTESDGKAAAGEKTSTTEKAPAKAKAAKDSGGSSSASSSSA